MKKEILLLLLILILGFSLRITISLVTADRIIQGDAAGYENCALEILSGKDLPRNASHPPFYPLFLAGVYLLFGHNPLIVGIIQSIIGIVTVLLVYLLTNQIFQT